MRRIAGAGRRIGFVLLGCALLACQSGCLAHLNPAPELTPADRSACSTLQTADRDHVHVYFINGLDPLDKGNLIGLSERVRELGFQNVSFAQMYDEPAMRREIVETYRQDPAARFVLVGFSFGANVVNYLAGDVQEDGVPIALLVYLGGDTLTNSADYRPANAQHIVNVTAQGCVWLCAGLIWQGIEIDGAENLRFENVDHFHIPTDPRVLQILREQLSAIAATGSAKSSAARSRVSVAGLTSDISN
jgi:hypothetical protein